MIPLAELISANFRQVAFCPLLGGGWRKYVVFRHHHQADRAGAGENHSRQTVLPPQKHVSGANDFHTHEEYGFGRRS